ncbi:polyamine aminopropyltransferase [Biomaibacter acetigenes]|uniref:Polyamine aminopropyltransferase n=1 Tax=Biomaibacter acetigenes TaxID=2316383 RepID=A0A3G2R5M7_9FIRM|nr:polyamine aminopropyltransferase [Biomaibacter acetigenes]AYO30655.1 polyamine aminopropyltransferase [Biomaibacter acetigenes]
MELWFSEYQSKNVRFSLRIKDMLYSRKTPYQFLSVFETEEMGRIMTLDDVVQLTTRDEFVYHEMISHVPLFTHRSPEKVLVIGGGDGGTIREILKHPVKKVHLVEIDEQVIEASKKFFPSLSLGFSDPRTSIFCEDGIEFVKNNKGYDVIIIDSTDPLGPAVGLFSREFYKDVFSALNNDGIMVAQTESPFFYGDFLKRVYGDISSIFRFTNIYTAVIPTYPGAFWTFTMGSKSIDPTAVDPGELPDLDTKYYSRDIHKSCFVLPPFVKNIISK